MTSATLMRPGVRIGVDVGSVRVGVATSDRTGSLASPATALRRDARGGRDLDQLAALVVEHDACEVVVGLPRSLRGDEGVAAQGARKYAAELAARVTPVPVRLVDERLSTVAAQRGLHDAGRDTRSSRPVIDAAAAAVILQAALDSERASGLPPGELVQT